MTKNECKINVTLDAIAFGLQSRGGISNYWDRLIKEILKNKKISSQIIIPKKISYTDFDTGLYSKLNLEKNILPNSLNRYLKVKDNGGCDIFHTSYYRQPKKKNTKYIVTVYDFIYERYSSGPKRLIHSFQKSQSIKKADAVICISESTLNDVQRFIPEIDPSRLHVVHLGVDQNDFYPEKNSDFNNLNNNVLYVGQRVGYKRFDLAIQALSLCPDLTLGIVGPPLSKKEVVLLNSNLFGRWYSFGSVSNEKLRQLYSNSLAFIFPSDYEGFGLPILEAMACGCPVVASNLSSFPEVGGHAALYSYEQNPEEYATALNKLYSSSTLRNNLVKSGLMKIENFSWKKVCDETIKIYQGTL